MSPAAKAIAYGVVSLAAFIIAFWWAYAALDRPPTGCHAREDAPTLGDALAGWLGERLPRWRDWPVVQWWYLQQYRRADREAFAAEMKELRERVAECALPDQAGTVPADPPGAVPLDIRATSRPDHPPWTTAGQPRLPEMMPAPSGAPE